MKCAVTPHARQHLLRNELLADCRIAGVAHAAADGHLVETNRESGRQIKMDKAVVDKVDSMWSELGLPGSGKKIWRQASSASSPCCRRS